MSADGPQSAFSDLAICLHLVSSNLDSLSTLSTMSQEFGSSLNCDLGLVVEQPTDDSGSILPG